MADHRTPDEIKAAIADARQLASAEMARYLAASPDERALLLDVPSLAGFIDWLCAQLEARLT